MAAPKANYTLNGLAEEVIRLFTSYRPTEELKLEKREVIANIRTIASELTRKRWYEVRQTGESKGWSQLYMGRFDGIAVEVDELTKENFIWLPVFEEDTPQGDGIQSIVPNTKNKDKNIQMIPIPPNAEVVLSQLPVGALEQRWGFMPKRNKVTFTRLRGRTLLEERITTVNVVMIVALADTVDDLSAPIAIPQDLVPELLRQTLAIFGVEKQLNKEGADLVNDNS